MIMGTIIYLSILIMLITVNLVLRSDKNLFYRQRQYFPFCLGSNRGPLTCKANILPRRFKNGVYQKVVKVCYIPIPCDVLPHLIEMLQSKTNTFFLSEIELWSSHLQNEHSTTSL